MQVFGSYPTCGVTNDSANMTGQQFLLYDACTHSRCQDIIGGGGRIEREGDQGVWMNCLPA